MVVAVAAASSSRLLTRFCMSTGPLSASTGDSTLLGSAVRLPVKLLMAAFAPRGKRMAMLKDSEVDAGVVGVPGLGRMMGAGVAVAGWSGATGVNIGVGKIVATDITAGEGVGLDVGVATGERSAADEGEEGELGPNNAAEVAAGANMGADVMVGVEGTGLWVDKDGDVIWAGKLGTDNPGEGVTGRGRYTGVYGIGVGMTGLKPAGAAAAAEPEPGSPLKSAATALAGP